MSQYSTIDSRCLPSSQRLHVAIWSEVLIAQHVQLKSEIDHISTLLIQPSFCILQLDAKLRRLIKGVKMHLELEHAFFTPILSQLPITSNQRYRLTEGYDALFATCESTIKLVKSIKFSPKNIALSSSHIQEIKSMFNDILARLADEDIAYSMIDNSEQQHA